MSDLLNSNRRNKKSSLDRGEDIKPEKTFSIPEKQQDLQNVTYPSNIKIDNHVRNMAHALSIIGYTESQKDSVRRALNMFVDQMPIDERRTFKSAYEMLEKKDTLSHSKKQSR